MNGTNTNVDSVAPTVPGHVPRELVREDGDFFTIDVGSDPQAAIAKKMFDGPPVFYVPRTLRFPNFGSWVFTRSEDLCAIMRDTEHFSSHGIAGFDQLIEGGESWLALPAEADPPDHAIYRALLNPLFSPARIKEYEMHLRAHVVKMIEEVRPSGQCDFVLLARKLPAGIFSLLLGLSIEETLHVIDSVKLIMHSGYDIDKRRQGVANIMAIEKELIARRRQQPGKDLISIALAATVDGRNLSEKEILGMFFFFLLAGIDSTVGATGFLFHYLALASEDCRRLVADKSLIPDAIEESLRRNSQITTNRFVKKDVEVGGVSLKAGDNVICSMVFANLDQQAFDHPLQVDISRSPNQHIAFGTGPHRCIGSNIARLQLRITAEEWLGRIPEFGIVEGADVYAINSEALAFATLPIRWNIPKTPLAAP